MDFISPSAIRTSSNTGAALEFVCNLGTSLLQAWQQRDLGSELDHFRSVAETERARNVSLEEEVRGRRNAWDLLIAACDAEGYDVVQDEEGGLSLSKRPVRKPRTLEDLKRKPRGRKGGKADA